MRILRSIKRGMGYVPGYGEHPGTPILIMFGFLGGIAGAMSHGFWGMLSGAALFLGVMGIPYLIGAYERGNGTE